MDLPVPQPAPVEGRSSEREVMRVLALLVSAANISGRTVRCVETAGTASFTEIWSTVMARDKVWLVEAVFVGRPSAGGAGGTFVRRATFWRGSGVVTQQGTTQTVGSDENALGVASGVELAVGSSDTTKVQARVKDAGVTTDWTVRIEVQEAAYVKPPSAPA